GSFLVARMDSGAASAAAAAGLDVAPLDERIRIGNYRVDPLEGRPRRAAALEGVPGVPATLAATEAGIAPRYYLLQFDGPVRPEWIEHARGAGAEVLQDIPENASLVRAPPATVARATATGEVRWAGLFHPAYKFSQELGWVVGAP